MPVKTQSIPWQPFTAKHAEYIGKALDSRVSVAEGAIRSGKTLDNCIIAMAYLETCADRIHVATGSSIRNAKLNIGDCNGFGLEFLFRGRCRWGKYRDNEALIIQTQTGEKIVIFAGGGQADSYRSILGNSFGLWIATEINEHYLNFDDPKISFVHVAFGRQIAARKPMTLWDLNPSNPGHRIYTDFIDKYRADGTANYQHFTLRDNGSLTPERIAEVEAQYIPGTVWHSRDILGQRCVAEGLIYPMFDEQAHAVETSKMRFGRYYVSVDYGTMNPFSAGLWGRQGNVSYRIREYYHDGRKEQRQLTDEEYYEKLVNLIGGLPVQRVVVDPSASSFIVCIERHGRYRVEPADNRVLDGIRNVANELTAGRLFIDRSCADAIRELKGYRWDNRAGDDKPVKQEDHAVDDIRYFVNTVATQPEMRTGAKPIGW